MITKTKVDIDDFLIMINWVFTFSALEQKSFNHMLLMEQAQTYKLSNTPLNTNIHKIDGFMVDVYRVYDRLVKLESKIESAYDTIFPMLSGMGGFPIGGGEFLSFPSKDVLIAEIEKFFIIFSDMMENFIYEETEIRGIQKNFLLDKIKAYSDDEEYEKAAQIRDILNTF